MNADNPVIGGTVVGDIFNPDGDIGGTAVQGDTPGGEIYNPDKHNAVPDDLDEFISPKPKDVNTVGGTAEGDDIFNPDIIIGGTISDDKPSAGAGQTYHPGTLTIYKPTTLGKKTIRSDESIEANGARDGHSRFSRYETERDRNRVQAGHHQNPSAAVIHTPANYNKALEEMPDESIEVNPFDTNKRAEPDIQSHATGTSDEEETDTSPLLFEAAATAFAVDPTEIQPSTRPVSAARAEESAFDPGDYSLTQNTVKSDMNQSPHGHTYGHPQPPPASSSAQPPPANSPAQPPPQPMRSSAQTNTDRPMRSSAQTNTDRPILGQGEETLLQNPTKKVAVANICSLPDAYKEANLISLYEDIGRDMAPDEMDSEVNITMDHFIIMILTNEIAKCASNPNGHDQNYINLLSAIICEVCNQYTHYNTSNIGTILGSVRGQKYLNAIRDNPDACVGAISGLTSQQLELTWPVPENLPSPVSDAIASIIKIGNVRPRDTRARRPYPAESSESHTQYEAIHTMPIETQTDAPAVQTIPSQYESTHTEPIETQTDMRQTSEMSTQDNLDSAVPIARTRNPFAPGNGQSTNPFTSGDGRAERSPSYADQSSDWFINKMTGDRPRPATSQSRSFADKDRLARALRRRYASGDSDSNSDARASSSSSVRSDYHNSDYTKYGAPEYKVPVGLTSVYRQPRFAVYGDGTYETPFTLLSTSPSRHSRSPSATNPRQPAGVGSRSPSAFNPQQSAGVGSRSPSAFNPQQPGGFAAAASAQSSRNPSRYTTPSVPPSLHPAVPNYPSPFGGPTPARRAYIDTSHNTEHSPPAARHAQDQNELPSDDESTSTNDPTSQTPGSSMSIRSKSNATHTSSANESESHTPGSSMGIRSKSNATHTSSANDSESQTPGSSMGIRSKSNATHTSSANDSGSQTPGSSMGIGSRSNASQTSSDSNTGSHNSHPISSKQIKTAKAVDSEDQTNHDDDTIVNEHKQSTNSMDPIPTRLSSPEPMKNDPNDEPKKTDQPHMPKYSPSENTTNKTKQKKSQSSRRAEEDNDAIPTPEEIEFESEDDEEHSGTTNIYSDVGKEYADVSASTIGHLNTIIDDVTSIFAETSIPVKGTSALVTMTTNWMKEKKKFNIFGVCCVLWLKDILNGQSPRDIKLFGTKAINVVKGWLKNQKSEDELKNFIDLWVAQSEKLKITLTHAKKKDSMLKVLDRLTPDIINRGSTYQLNLWGLIFSSLFICMFPEKKHN